MFRSVNVINITLSLGHFLSDDVLKVGENRVPMSDSAFPYGRGGEWS